MQNFPVQLRIALGTLLSFLVAPHLASRHGHPIQSPLGLVMVDGLRKLALGLLLGFHVPAGVSRAGNLRATLSPRKWA